MSDQKLINALSDLLDVMTGRMDGEAAAIHNAVIVLNEAKAEQALASQQKPAPVLLTDEELFDIYKKHFELGPEKCLRAIESAALRKQGWGV